MCATSYYLIKHALQTVTHFSTDDNAGGADTDNRRMGEDWPGGRGRQMGVS